VNLGSATILRGDARRLPLPDNTVDLIVTSPPYFALRSYQDGGEHYAGQLGSEATPVEFVDALLEVTRECVRVLKPSGSLWVNLGDKYDSGTGTPRKNGGDRMADGREVASWNTGAHRVTVGRPKSLMGIPWRYALACIDQLGLILRAEIIWSKPNGLPESVTDRVRRSHEQWLHFVAQPRYYSAVDEIREDYTPSSIDRARYSTDKAMRGRMLGSPTDTRDTATPGWTTSPLGRLPGSVWTIPTEPLTVPPELGVDHFAAFPTEWPRRIIQGWSPGGICVECGEGRRPVSLANYEHINVTSNAKTNLGALLHNGIRTQPAGFVGRASVTITGYVCACPTPDAPTRPAIILDPFGGTGTVALAAKALGRHGISIDLSHDYSRLAQWRTTDPGQLAKAARVDKPPVEVDDQLDLFGIGGGAA